MIITLSGITGVGKSYYKNYIVDTLGLKNLLIYTTRLKRENEIEGIDKNFVSKEEFGKLKEQGKFFFWQEFLDEQYGYVLPTEERISITELHYEWIYKMKENYPKIYAIYMIPKDISSAKEQLQKRNLPKEIEEKRLQEIRHHIEKINQDTELKKQFDYIFYNDYTERSDKKMLELIKEILQSNKWG